MCHLLALVNMHRRALIAYSLAGTADAPCLRKMQLCFLSVTLGISPLQLKFV